MIESVAALFKELSENSCTFLAVLSIISEFLYSFGRSFFNVQDLSFAYDELRSLNQVPQAKVKLQWCVDHIWDHVSFIRVT